MERQTNQPLWVTRELSPNDIAAINQGGCASGAYMPAVTYGDASETMHEHGDEVLTFIENYYGEIPQPKKGESWTGMACFYLSAAVELLCSINEDLADWEDETPVDLNC